ncbi:MAG: Zn-dependent alcohol dehydrogenase [Hyphomicrobiales bacterium]
MKAAVCREFGQPLTIENVHLAEPGEDEVQIKISACAICHSDITFIEGGWGGALPAIWGHEASGIVAQVGPGVSDIQAGDFVVVTLIRSCGECHYCAQGRQVMCDTSFALDESSPLKDQAGDTIGHGLRTGAFAEFATVHRSQVVKISQDIPVDSASLLACGVITGLGAVWNTADVPAGAHVVVIGCGGVGLNSIQGAALRGAKTVIALDVAQNKLEAARKFGATHCIQASDAGAVAQVQAITDQRGADYVFVTVGVKPVIDNALAYLASGGSAVIVGMPPSNVMAEYDPGTFAALSQRILGSKMGSARVQIDVPLLADMYLQGRLKLDELITGRYMLEEINDAIASVKRGDALRNVIMF